MPSPPLVRLACVVCLVSTPAAARAQALSAHADFFFFGDNTEFANPFRRGETTFGTAGRIYLEFELGDRARLRGGFFGRGRFGSGEFLEQAEPHVALEIGTDASRLILGSLETTFARGPAAGPDLDGPHGLLPPLQQDTLVFDRAHDLGLQWLVATPRVDSEAWINWQRLNTAEHRERFDAGYRGRFALTNQWAAHAQWHVVHEGGQRFASGPVRDSHAWAPGLEWRTPVGAAELTLDGYAVVTRDTPDRERPGDTRTGVGGLVRAAVARSGWRGHVLVWRGCDVLKDEGDPHYLARRLDGRLARGTRDYQEAGVARVFRPAPDVVLTASARLHRIEQHIGYSYRIAAQVGLRYPF